jgi:hypothetical protein
MNDKMLLTMTRLPARLDTAQTAQLLGFADHDIHVLVKAKLLKPLGNPVPSAPKFFAGCEIETCARDPQWLDKATRAVTQHWRRKNASRLEQTSSVPA